MYKVPSGSKFPTDAILIHSNRALITVDERDVKALMP